MFAISAINHAYIGIKLWLMLARKKALHGGDSTSKGNAGNAEEILVWTELWPTFESLVNIFEAEAQTENISVSGPSFRLLFGVHVMAVDTRHINVDLVG